MNHSIRKSGRAFASEHVLAVLAKILFEEVPRASELRPGIPVLYMSGYAQAVIGPMGDLSAGHTILDKPFTEAALLERVADALSRARA